MSIANFTADLAWSQAQANHPMWGEVYRQAFSDFAGMIYVGKGPQQQDGVDRIVTTTTGHVHRIDEKSIRRDYESIFLEYWSAKEQRKPGWIAKDLACDFIAYAFIPSRRCYLLPFPTLRRAWKQHHVEWVANYHPRQSPNRGYMTEGVPVPIPVVLDAIRDAALIRWAEVKA